MNRLFSFGFLGLALLALHALASIAQGPAKEPVAPPDLKLFQQLFVQQPYTPTGFGGALAVAFSPDGTKVITGGSILPETGRPDGPANVRIWDAKTGKQLLATRTGVMYRDFSIGFSPDGKRFVSYAGRFVLDATSPIMHVRDATTGQPLLALHPWANSFAFSPDGKHILVSASTRIPVDIGLALWDATTGQVARNFSAELAEARKEAVKSVAFSRDGKKFATIGKKSTGSGRGPGGVSQFADVVRMWDFESGKVTHTNVLSFNATGLAYGPQDKVIVAGHSADLSQGATAWVNVFDAASGKETLTLKTKGTGAQSVCCSADGKRIVTGNYDGTIRVWDAESGKELAILRGHVNVVQSVAFSPDGTKIASGGSDGTFRIWGIPATPGQQPQPKAGK